MNCSELCCAVCLPYCNALDHNACILSLYMCSARCKPEAERWWHAHHWMKSKGVVVGGGGGSLYRLLTQYIVNLAWHVSQTHCTTRNGPKSFSSRRGCGWREWAGRGGGGGGATWGGGGGGGGGVGAGGVWERRGSRLGAHSETLPDLVTSLKGHSLSPRCCPPTRSAPSEKRFGY